MQFKLAITAAVLSAIAVLAAPAPCESSWTSSASSTWPAPTSSSSTWSAPTSSSSTWVPESTSSTWAPAPSSSSTWAPTTSATETWAQSSAAPQPTSGAGSCNAGPVVCCNSAQSANNLDDGVTALLGLLGINVSDLANDVGLGCTSLVGGASCSSNTLCCENNSFSGIVAIGCVPIDISL
ncbi:hydrophobin-domain-containing protein [Daedalea quercina L-15889]|uniref:Hydrophobin n=1 Tax=Daedalea quercina L-15889 TaxID=1314783 RepID=A0A165NY51_9APHY|nr:hydrophobin-domain-containing protein [Daedalea quercina L-15889]